MVVSMIDAERLQILTESARYDVSCSSSGSNKNHVLGGLGSKAMGGICHSFTPDGRCISLLKIVMTNICSYNCEYCVNRRSSDVKRAIATPDEICCLTMEFYRRNYIEGLFLSSAVYKNADYTMELLLETVIKLRKLYGFNGYIHLKGIPGADIRLIFRAGEYVDRMSFNLELPSEKSLKLLAPQKSKKSILLPMSNVSGEIQLNKSVHSKFLPAGQTTQMIVGASPESDGQIIKLSSSLYEKYKLKRVYYSSYVPVNRESKLLPNISGGLVREHRLYQADWLIRFYGFTASEIASENENLPLEYDPKCAYALRHPELFPVEINKAPLELLLRVPGIGIRSAYKIIKARKFGRLDYSSLVKMKISLKRAIHFITIDGKFLGTEKVEIVKQLLENNDLLSNYTQLSMFSSKELSTSIITGEI